MDSGTTYLINRNGTVKHTWVSDYLPGEAVWWLGDGTILRTIKVGGSGTGGSGGGVQILQSDGTVTWDYRCNTNGNLSHHDVKTLPNGDVLLISWETKTRDETIASGRDPNHIMGPTFLPDMILEVQPTGPTSGAVVWEWHVWDHLIQDYDSSKANYGVVENHPELVDINYAASSGYDWLHCNSIDYNQSFDQIMISAHNFDEFWIIDHSTTTEQAAGHSGGRSGKGGDLLYRWGNPQAYRRGNASDQKLFGQHDVTWIKSGFPGAGDILVFNNGELSLQGQHYSSIEEIIPPVNHNGSYNLAANASYGPQGAVWTYTANPPTSFFSNTIGGACRLKDGDTLICNGEKGEFFEVTPDGTTVWDYTNPYPAPSLNNVFKIVFIPPEEPPGPHIPDLDCFGNFSQTDITPGATVNGSFQVKNIGDAGSLLNWTVNTSLIPWGTWTFTPRQGENLTPEDGTITVNLSVIVPDEKNKDFEGYIRVENVQNPNDFCVIPVTLKTPANSNILHAGLFYQLFEHFLQRHPYLEKVWNSWICKSALHHSFL